MRVLIIDSDHVATAAIENSLRERHHSVVIERTGEGGFFRASTEAFDLILMEIDLPGRDGLEILRKLRVEGVATPVLVVTARNTLSDRLAMLEAGADDYLSKPFEFVELLACMQTLYRKTRTVNNPTPTLRGLWVNTTERRVNCAGQVVVSQFA